MLEAERNEARGLLALIQSQSEAEAQELLRRVRRNTHGDDMGTLIRRIRDEGTAGIILEQIQRQHQEQEHQQHGQPTSLDPSALGSVIRLPPLRSVVEVPPMRTNTAVGQPASASAEDTERV